MASNTRPGGLRGRALIVALVLLAAGCATRVVVPPLPAALTHPDFLYPVVPEALAGTGGADAIDRGWRFLQNDDLRNADREFSQALKRAPELYPAQAGAAYVALARGDHGGALTAFGAVLRADPVYVPALVGQGQSLLRLGRDGEALTSFEAALVADGSLSDVRRRVEVLRFRSLQEIIEGARAAASGGRLDEARTAYGQALDASPDSAFLYRELGVVERRRGNAAEALAHLRRAADLDPGDATSLIQMGEIFEQQQDFARAEATYRAAADIEPTDELARRIAAAGDRAREARMPAEFRAIGGSPQITRGDLAALIGTRLEQVIGSAAPREVVVTDLQGHWAEPWITQVARAGAIEPFANHTFQPRAGLRRADLAIAVSRLVALMAAGNPALRAHLTARPPIADMPAGHLNYPAASVAVASGVMPLLDGGRFQVSRPVSGTEALDAIARLRTLAGTP